MSAPNDPKDLYKKKDLTFLVQHGLEARFLSALANEFEVIKAKDSIIIVSEEEHSIKD